MALQVGLAEIERVEEQTAPYPVSIFTEDSAFYKTYAASLAPGLPAPSKTEIELVFQSWIIRVDGLTVVVDPCNGNGRYREGLPIFSDLNTSYLERFAQTGTATEAVDAVFCTHLHCDHCGWNTKREGGKWVPTFPNARYYFVDREYARWNPTEPEFADNQPVFNETVYAESILPIIDAGLAQIVSTPHQISPSLTIEDAAGHTRGHALLRLETEGRHGYFVGDALHHPSEVLRPTLHILGASEEPDTVEATRQRMLSRIVDEKALMFPAHFSWPHYGRVKRNGDGYSYIPGGGEGALARTNE